MDKYKLICSDIDGTLLNKDRQLSTRTIKVFKQIKDHTPIVLISSRMPRAMRHLQRELDILQQPLIAYNGGLVVDYKEEDVNVLLSIEVPMTITDKLLAFVLYPDLLHHHKFFTPPFLPHQQLRYIKAIGQS